MTLVVIALISISASAQGIKTEKLLETTTSWDGKTLPMYPTTQPKVTILRITIPPKTKLPEHYHSVLNFAVVTKGVLKVVKEDGEELVIKRGEAVAEVLGDYHYGINEGSEPVELYVFYAGDEGSPLSIKKHE